MIHFDKNRLNNRFEELARDISAKKVTSASWLWLGMGAITGLVLSCLKIKKRDTKPIFGTFEKGIEHGKFNMHWNSKNNSGC